jgi:nucleoside-diphosphate-sugar epimerase
VERIVVASSLDVYAPFGALYGKEEHAPLPHPLNEEGPLRTSRQIQGGENDKLYAEGAFLEYQRRLPVTLVRMPAVYGPNDSRRRFIEWTKRMVDGRPAVLLEPGMANFRWTHGYVENVAHALALAVTTPHADGVTARIYNVGEAPPSRDAGFTNGAPTVAERLHWVARAAGYRGKIVVVPRDRCPAHLIYPLHFEHDVVTSDARIRAELGFAEVVSMEEGLKRTVAWQRANMPTDWPTLTADYAAEDQVLGELGIV